MKIFFPIGAFYPSQIGGPCNTVYWHTTALKNKDLQVDIVTTSLGIQPDSVPLNRSLEMECGKVFYGEKTGISWEVFKEIRRGIEEADVIHLNGLFNTLCICSFFYSKIFYPKKKIIWTVRGELNDTALGFSSLKKQIILYFYKKLSSNVIFHGTSTKEMSEIATTFPASKLVQLPNFIQPHDKLQLPYDKNFLYVGRIHPIKALDKLIEGFAASKDFRDSDFKLIIVGTHEERYQKYDAALKSKIIQLNLQDKIEWKGHLKGLEKEQAYAKAYALLLVSETENFGNVVVESLNQGTPVIASKGTPWSILEQYNCGYHISNEPKAIANKIDEMINVKEEQYLAMRKNACKLIEEEFDVKHHIGKWIKIYNDEKE